MEAGVGATVLGPTKESQHLTEAADNKLSAEGKEAFLVASMGSSWQDSRRTQMPSDPLLGRPGSPSLPECLEVNRPRETQGLLRKRLKCSKEISRVSQPHPPQGGKSGPKSSSRLNWAG